jgi:type 1 fimbriae regulatory protein FimB
MIAQQPLAPEHVRAGLEAARRIGPREFCLATLAAQHGLRANELGRIRLSDLNLREGTLRVTPGKNSVATVENLKPETVKAIEAWLEVKPQSDFLFPQARDNSASLHRRQVYEVFVNIAKAAGIPSTSRSPHAWRHAIGYKLTDDGVPLQTVARVLRHRSIQSTMFYTHAREKQAQAARELLDW